MNWSYLPTIAIGGAVAASIFYDVVVAPILRQRRYGESWRRYNAGACPPIVVAHSTGNAHRVWRVGIETRSTGGKYAIVLEHGGSGVVVHEFTHAAEFSSRGPCYIKLSRVVWGETGNRHLIETLVYPPAVPTSNPGGGRTREVGVRIVETNTDKYAPLTLGQFAEREESKKKRPRGRN